MLENYDTLLFFFSSFVQPLQTTQRGPQAGLQHGISYCCSALGVCVVQCQVWCTSLLPRAWCVLCFIFTRRGRIKPYHNSCG